MYLNTDKSKKNLWFGNWSLSSFINISTPIDNNIHIKTETTTYKWKLFNMKKILVNLTFGCSALAGVIQYWYGTCCIATYHSTLLVLRLYLCVSFNNPRCHVSLLCVVWYQHVCHSTMLSVILYWCGSCGIYVSSRVGVMMWLNL